MSNVHWYELYASAPDHVRKLKYSSNKCNNRVLPEYRPTTEAAFTGLPVIDSFTIPYRESKLTKRSEWDLTRSLPEWWTIGVRRGVIRVTSHPPLATH